MRVFPTVEAIRGAVGEHQGFSDWITITQERINLFADATDDHQWIHIDTEAAANGPFGTTIAHGFLTLSLVVPLTSELTPLVEGISMAINYGVNKVRFPSPVPVNSRVRAGLTLASVEEITGGLHLVNEVTVEREGGDKPACVAETVIRYYF